MAYTLRERIKYKNIFKKLVMIDDYRYTKILLYKEEEIANNIIFEIHLRIESFKIPYDKCYEYIANRIKENPIFNDKIYSELNAYIHIFKKYGYEFNEIITYIFHEISLINNYTKIYGPSKSEYKRINLFTTNSRTHIPAIENSIQFSDNPFSLNILSDDPNKPYIKEYYDFEKMFDIYKYAYSMPSNKFFLEENSINVNIVLNKRKVFNDMQIVNILNLIKNTKVASNNYNIDELSKKKLSDIGNYFYLYDISLHNIPMHFIRDFTDSYLHNESKTLIELSGLKNTLEKTFELIKSLNDEVMLFSRNININIKEIKKFISKLKVILNSYEEINLISKRIFYKKLEKFTNDTIKSYKKIEIEIESMLDKEQAKKIKTLTKRDILKQQQYINNYNETYYDISYYKFGKYFPLCDTFQSDELTWNINDIKNPYKIIYKEDKKEDKKEDTKEDKKVVPEKYKCRVDVLKSYNKLIYNIIERISMNYK